MYIYILNTHKNKQLFLTTSFVFLLFKPNQIISEITFTEMFLNYFYRKVFLLNIKHN